MVIDKRSISGPVAVVATLPDNAPFNLQSAKKIILATMRQRIDMVHNDGQGVDLEHMKGLCEEVMSKEELNIITKCGGWSRFTLSETRRKDSPLSAVQEGTRTTIMPRDVVDLEQLRAEIEEIRSQDNTGRGASPDALRELERQLPREPAIRLPAGGRQTPQEINKSEQPANVDVPALSRHQREVLEIIPKITNQKCKEFYKDAVRQDALRFLRSVSLFTRFSDVFQGRSFESIVRLLEEEGDVVRLGGFMVFAEMAVHAGYFYRNLQRQGDPFQPKKLAFDLIGPIRNLLGNETKTPADLTVLEQQLWENYQALKPTKTSDRQRQNIVRDIQRHLDHAFPKVGFLVELFGSSGNGLYFPGSDSDVCAYYSTVPPPQEINIHRLGGTLRRTKWCKDITVIGHAKIPVIKMTHTQSDLPVDISIENTIAIENTRLIRLYMELDPRAKPLVYALKVWCKSRAISHPKDGSLSSYSWTLMMIHYLQRTTPAVLPNLQDPDALQVPFSHSYDGEIIDCYYDESPTFSSENEESSASLFLGFFRYFSHFPFSTQVIDIKPTFNAHGQEINCLSKDQKGKADWKSKAIAIQDPFIWSRNTAVGCSPVIADWTFAEIERAHRILRGGGSFADMVTFGTI